MRKTGVTILQIAELLILLENNPSMIRSKRNMSGPDKSQKKLELILKHLTELRHDLYTGQISIEISMNQGGMTDVYLRKREQITRRSSGKVRA